MYICISNDILLSSLQATKKYHARWIQLRLGTVTALIVNMLAQQFLDWGSAMFHLQHDMAIRGGGGGGGGIKAISCQKEARCDWRRIHWRCPCPEVQSAVDDSVRCCGECQPGDRGYEVRCHQIRSWLRSAPRVSTHESRGPKVCPAKKQRSSTRFVGGFEESWVYASSTIGPVNLHIPSLCQPCARPTQTPRDSFTPSSALGVAVPKLPAVASMVCPAWPAARHWRHGWPVARAGQLSTETLLWWWFQLFHTVSIYIYIIIYIYLMGWKTFSCWQWMPWSCWQPVAPQPQGFQWPCCCPWTLHWCSLWQQPRKPDGIPWSTGYGRLCCGMSSKWRLSHSFTRCRLESSPTRSRRGMTKCSRFTEQNMRFYDTNSGYMKKSWESWESWGRYLPKYFQHTSQKNIQNMSRILQKISALTWGGSEHASWGFLELLGHVSLPCLMGSWRGRLTVFQLIILVII